MTFERFSFERIGPERQHEILEKQRKQEEQRRMLREQIDDRERKMSRSVPPSTDDNDTKPERVMDSGRRAAWRPSNTSHGKAATQQFKPPVFIARPLLPERESVIRSDRPTLAMTVNPDAIRNAFANVRSRIVSTSGATLRPRATLTFAD